MGKKFIGTAVITNTIGIGIIDIDDLEDQVTYCWFSNDTIKKPITTELLYNVNNSEFYFVDNNGSEWFLSDFTRV